MVGANPPGPANDNASRLTALVRLLDKIAAEIAATGPITVARYMELALLDPEHGYYVTQNPFGSAGDFVTAPEISQMFGEMIGLWLGATWQAMGAPPRVVLAELGPGRGTLMADILRAGAYVPGFVGALEICLVEASPRLREIQKQSLTGYAVTWVERVEDLPSGPILAVANEFFDALPIFSYFYHQDKWYQRLIGFQESTGLTFEQGESTSLSLSGAEGDVFETCPEGARIARILAKRVTRDGGAALIIDYGHARSAMGDTLQAVHRHRYHPVLENPGEADLTAHVDFQALAEAAIPARVHGPTTQGDFLRALGIETRAQLLAQHQPKDGAAKIAADMRRLIDGAEMGTLFKVMALAHPAHGPLIGF